MLGMRRQTRGNQLHAPIERRLATASANTCANIGTNSTAHRRPFLAMVVVATGSIDTKGCQAKIVDIMEGGMQAFERER